MLLFSNLIEKAEGFRVDVLVERLDILARKLLLP